MSTSIFDRAAQANDQYHTDFTVELAHREADCEFTDRIYIQLDPDTFDRFHALLDIPPVPSEALRQLLLIEARWDRDDDAGHLND